MLPVLRSERKTLTKSDIKSANKCEVESISLNADKTVACQTINKKRKRRKRRKKKKKQTSLTLDEASPHVEDRKISTHVKQFDRVKCLQKLRKRKKFARQGINPQVAAQKVREEIKKNPQLMDQLQQNMISSLSGNNDSSEMPRDTLQQMMNLKGLSAKQKHYANRFLQSLSQQKHVHSS